MAQTQMPPPSAHAGWALWFTGLPGCGKSTIARAVHGELARRGVDASLLLMDERRKAYFPHPAYSAEERAQAYTLFAREAADLVAAGRGVILDATAHRLVMRQEARSVIPRFAEVLVRCPLPEAMRREAVRSSQSAMGGHHRGYVMPGMYQKAIMRKRTGVAVPGLGQVVGVDVQYEENPEAECVLDAMRPVEENARAVLQFLDAWLPGLPPEPKDAA
ncbi:MAG: adenylyl-sulfate kinase [Humidesulfovibrio sp.]|uniref:adenylyl-sulfate kinase n=1 Tax=Humidesulfovibrio sp. TaxID=2910988 RepID=UPI002735F5AF|nr:adenylyl-sulfate kinase [Humidesulfovibrio sp.]MDP2846980.1 adenylyl-sulfate kinase [Humidesulfovibrio sp.]